MKLSRLLKTKPLIGTKSIVFYDQSDPDRRIFFSMAFVKNSPVGPADKVIFNCPFCNNIIILYFNAVGVYNCMGHEINPEVASICDTCHTALYPFSVCKGYIAKMCHYEEFVDCKKVNYKFFVSFAVDDDWNVPTPI